MIENNHPDVNVDELMARIREEVAQPRASNSPAFSLESRSSGSLRGLVDWSQINANLQAVEYHVLRLGKVVPGWARFGWIKRKVAGQIARFVLYLSSFILNQQKQVNVATLNALRAIDGGLRNLEKYLGEHGGRKGEVDQALSVLREAVRRIEEEQQSGLQRVETELVRQEGRIQETARTQAEALQRVETELVRQEGRIQETARTQAEALQRVETELVRQEGRIQETARTQAEALQRVEAELARREEWIQQVEQGQQQGLQRVEAELARREAKERNLERTLYQVKMDLIQQERRITVLLEEARKRLPAPFDHAQLHMFVSEDQHRFDALYVSFEDQFRGTREDIKERLRIYLPLLKENGVGTDHLPILDVGCGRGEWLELLQEEGLRAQGVDINRVLIEQCRQRDLEVNESDALAYLRKLPDRSVGAVTGFHIIEHLSLENLIHLLDETVRVLAPGGVAIFETPNPQNVIVGSYSFYFDPTHQKPLPSPVMKFLAEARGLCRVQLLTLHPYPAAFRLEGSELAERFSDYFYGPQDYAIIGAKIH